MRILRHTADVPAEVLGATVALGNFDGMHRGHQVVLEKTREQARGHATAVLTFEPHPRSFFAPEAPPFRLTSLRDKTRAIERCGIDFLIVQHFDKAFASQSAETFVRRTLVGDLKVAHVVTGYDFRFGRERKGDATLLQALAERFGFAFTAVSPVRSGEAIYASTAIREYLWKGEPAKAARLLGRPWEIEGRVEEGAGRGRGLGFPTANLALGDHLHPKAGIYAVRAGVDAGLATVWRKGVAYLGTRPTFGAGNLLLEVHFFDAAPDLYGKHLRVQMIEFLREDATFEDGDHLRRQMEEDAKRAREVLAAADDPA